MSGLDSASADWLGVGEGVVDTQRGPEPPECVDRVLSVRGARDGDEVIKQGLTPQAQRRDLMPGNNRC